MKNRFLIWMLVIIFPLVTALAWDCGCALAEIMPETKIQNAQSVSEHCHDQAESSHTDQGQSDEQCCPGCQLERVGPPQSAPDVLGVQNAISEKIPTHKTFVSTEFIDVTAIEKNISRSNVGSDTTRVSSSELPLYLFNQTFLI